MKFYKLLTVACFSAIFACSASAGVVYTNGILDGTVGGAQISPGQIVSDSFTLLNTTTLERATLGLWTPSNTRPESLTWSIGSSPFDNDLGTGAAILSSAQVGAQGSFDVYLATFDFYVALDAGGYWLTLSDGVSTDGAALGWDINSGPSQAFYRNLNDSGTADSEYFALEGTQVADPGPSPVPEPGSLALFAGGLICVAAVRRRLTRTS